MCFHKLLPDNTDLPDVLKYFRLGQNDNAGYIDLIKMQNGSSFLRINHFGKGIVYEMAVPLNTEFSNFPKHAIFVPSFYNIALLSAATEPLYYTIGKNEAISLNDNISVGDNVFKIKQHDGSFEFIPEMRNQNKQLNFYVNQQLTQAGHFDLTYEDLIIKGLAFNYDRRESLMDYFNPRELQETFEREGFKHFEILSESQKPLEQSISELNQGIKLWKLFIILALIFLGIEAVLLRFWVK